MNSFSLLRSLLFVPAGTTKMLAKIEALTPDAFILDLEDSVPLEQKQTARDNIAAYLKRTTGDTSIPPLYIRCNDLDSNLWREDLGTTFHKNISGYVVPKFESTEKVIELQRTMAEEENSRNIPVGTMAIILQIESMRGCRELFELNRTSFLRRLKGLAFGGEDYLGSLSRFCEIDPEMLDYARKLIVLHARALDVPAIDTVYKNFRDAEGLKKESETVARMGFEGKLAIHPNQIEPINACFSPSSATLERARKILEIRDQIEQRGAIDAGGVMLDRAHLTWALELHDRWLT